MTAALQRRLTLTHAVVIGLGSMIGAGVFTAIGLAAALTLTRWVLLALLALAVAVMLWAGRRRRGPAAREA